MHLKSKTETLASKSSRQVFCIKTESLYFIFLSNVSLKKTPFCLFNNLGDFEDPRNIKKSKQQCLLMLLFVFLNSAVMFTVSRGVYNYANC